MNPNVTAFEYILRQRQNQNFNPQPEVIGRPAQIMQANSYNNWNSNPSFQSHLHSYSNQFSNYNHIPVNIQNNIPLTNSHHNNISSQIPLRQFEKLAENAGNIPMIGPFHNSMNPVPPPMIQNTPSMLPSPQFNSNIQSYPPHPPIIHYPPIPNQYFSSISRYASSQSTNIPNSIPINAPYVPRPKPHYTHHKLDNKSHNKPKFQQNHVEIKTESQVMYCEVCDKEYHDKAAYEAHTLTHEKCRHPGCKFEGTRKIVNAHYLALHGKCSGTGYKEIDVEGQKFTVLMGTSPAEVAQWRADRKRKFPTTENVLKKEQQRGELIDAGGIIPKNELRKGKKRKLPTDSNSYERFRESKFNQDTNTNKADSTNSKQTISPTTTATALIIDTQNSSSAASTVVDSIVPANNEPLSNNVTGISEEQDIKPICKFFITRGFCRKGKHCNFAHDKQARKNMLKEKATVKQQENNKDDQQNNNQSEVAANPDDENKGNKNRLKLPKPLNGGIRGTLLRKLLSSEIEKEENFILQCFRYLVRNNFFDVCTDPTIAACSTVDDTSSEYPTTTTSIDNMVEIISPVQQF